MCVCVWVEERVGVKGGWTRTRAQFYQLPTCRALFDLCVSVTQELPWLQMICQPPPYATAFGPQCQTTVYTRHQGPITDRYSVFVMTEGDLHKKGGGGSAIS